LRAEAWRLLFAPGAARFSPVWAARPRNALLVFVVALGVWAIAPSSSIAVQRRSLLVRARH